MVTKTDSPSFIGDSRLPFMREIVGIATALGAILIFMALLSAAYQSHWIGSLGDTVANALRFVFGRYVVFVLPAILGIIAFHTLRGTVPATRYHGWLRVLGGILVLTASCALLTHSVSGVEAEANDKAFRLGGLVGNILVSSTGLNLGGILGSVGAYITFTGLVLIGLVLFTETMLRDLTRLAWSGLRQLSSLAFRPFRWIGRLRIPVPRWVKSIWHGVLYILNCIRQVFYWIIRSLHWSGELFHRAADGLNQVTFRQSVPRHVMPVGPVVELGSEKVVRQKIEEPEEEKPSERTTGRTRSSVFPRSKTKGLERDEEEGVAIERNGDPRPQLDRRKTEASAATQQELELFPATYQLPGFELLSDPPSTRYEMSDDEKRRMSQKIEHTLAQFRVEVEVIEVIQGPVITRFALKLAPGVRVNRIQALESELAMTLKAHHVRILAPIPGQSAVGVEVPNRRANPVLLKEMLDSAVFEQAKSPLTFALGKNIAGEEIVCDLAKMPHLLIAGATGSGKSVCLNAIIASMLFRNPPDRIKFVMVDPKRVELSIYQAIPHLLSPVVSEARKAASALAWCVEQMESRYKLLAEIGVRNLDSYNALLTDAVPSKKIMGRGDLKYLPHVVIIIDELADLMAVAKNQVEEYVIRLAQMARAVGMHLIIATQRPSVNVITGIIKANFPSRIAFQVSSKVDSRTILDMNGAEALMGRGDMLYSPGGSKPFRIQGAFVSDTEVERLADYIRHQERARYEKEDFEIKPTPAERAKAQIDENASAEIDYAGDDPCERTIHNGLAVEGLAASAPLAPADMDSLDDNMLYDMALRLILESRKASVSYIQRRMKIGYARAGRIMDMLEEQGIVGPYQGSKPRNLLVDPADYLEKAKS